MNDDFINNPNYEENDSSWLVNFFHDSRSVFDLDSNMEMNYYLYQSDIKVINREESVLSESLLIKNENSEIRNIENIYPNWSFFLLGLSIFILLFSNLIFYRKNNFNLKLLFNIKKFGPLLNEQSIFSNWNSVLLYQANIILLSLVTFNSILLFFGINLFNNFSNLIIALIFFLLFDLAKFSINIYLGLIFKKKHTFFLINSNLLYIRTILPIVVIIPTLLSFFVDNIFFILAAVVLASLLECYRILRQIILLIVDKEFSTLYNILYLCTLEIIPILVLYKLALGYI